MAITVLVDNRADLLVKSTDTVKRFTEQPLLAEHGFAALIDLKDAGPPTGGTRILWDAGMTQTALLENARRMEIDLSTIDVIALSHGHGDHTAAMTEVHPGHRRLCPGPRVGGGGHDGRDRGLDPRAARAAGGPSGRLSGAMGDPHRRDQVRAGPAAAARRVGGRGRRGDPFRGAVPAGTGMLDDGRCAAPQF